jgi:hypothetical protein
MIIADFDDFCVATYVIVDDIWQRIEAHFHRPGPAPRCSDSELLTMALVGECRGWDQETDLLSHWRERRDLFPQIPSQSRFNRRRRNLSAAFNLLRRVLLHLLDAWQDRQGVIDSLPLPVIQFHLVPGSKATGRWRSEGASFGYVPTKKQAIFGYKLHLLVTLDGIILDFILAPAHLTDITVGEELLVQHTDLEVMGDKGYVSATVAAMLWAEHRIRLRTVPRKNQHQQQPAVLNRLITAMRQIIETVNGQLDEQFHLETNRAHTLWGLATRLHTKLAAHTLCIYLNRLVGHANPLQIKHLAFPN